MIRHIVMFKIKDEYKDEIPQLVKNFYGMKGKIEGMVDLEDGTLVPYPTIFEQHQPAGKHINFNAIGGPCTSYELVAHDQTEVSFCGDDLETLKKIREAKLHCEVIMVTAANDTATLEEAIHLGVIDFLIKPFAYERFLVALEKFITKKEAFLGAS